MSDDYTSSIEELKKVSEEIRSRGAKLNKDEVFFYLSKVSSANTMAATSSGDSRQIGDLKVITFGKAGAVSGLMSSLRHFEKDDLKEVSIKINAEKEDMLQIQASRKAEIEAQEMAAKLAAEREDMTLPVALPPSGSVHPISQVMDELAEIFADLGFAVATGPEIEDDWHNFTALNIPEHHPARAMHDTFYVDGPAREGAHAGERLVLRTHTSPVQIRTMMGQQPPIRIIAPGRVYRSDSDATHTPMFHQIEGLVIDRDTTMAQLRWTLETFIKDFFEVDDVVLRFRPSYFPFTEPSVEVDVGYSSKTGKPAAPGEADKWLEVLGAGMVHPRVLLAAGLDPEEWQGFAFGTGVDRLAMLKYGLTDLRAFFDGDLRWLKHHGFSAFDVPTISAGVGA